MRKPNKLFWLTLASLTGFGATVYSAIKATDEYNKDADARHYIPTLVIGLGTVATIVGTSVYSANAQASLAGACTILDTTYHSYRDKVKQQYGVKADKEIIEEIVCDRSNDKVIFTQDLLSSSSLDFGDENEPTKIYYDGFSDRYFKSTHTRVLQAEYHLNRNYMLKGEVTLNEFYELLGIPPIEGGDEIGWSNFNGYYYWIDFDHHKVPFDIDVGEYKDIELYLIDYVYEPSYEMLHEDLC